VKRTELKEYSTTRTGAIVACKVADSDEVLRVGLSDGTREILLVTKAGMSIRFREAEVSAMGRAAGGVRGIQLKDDDEVVAADWVSGEEGELLVVSDLGYGKSSLLIDYPIQGRGGKGVATFEFKEGKRVRANGQALVAAFFVKEAYDLSGICASGALHKFSTEKAAIEERKSAGKQLVSVNKNDLLVDVYRLV
jgi:topoisomerase-4 subunit A